MITIETLKDYGADTASGLARCMNMEAFYLRLVRTELNDPNFDKLAQALQNDQAKEAFEAAHALKGALGNLSLDPLYEPASKLTEMLRHAQTTEGTQELLAALQEALEKLRALDEK